MLHGKLLDEARGLQDEIVALRRSIHAVLIFRSRGIDLAGRQQRHALIEANPQLVRRLGQRLTIEFDRVIEAGQQIVRPAEVARGRG